MDGQPKTAPLSKQPPCPDNVSVTSDGDGNGNGNGASIGGDDDYAQAHRRSLAEPEQFWGKLAYELIDWDVPFTSVLDDSKSPSTKWFAGGYLNACYNAVDRHIGSGHGNNVAIIHDSPMTNVVRHVTYQELFEKVSRMAGGLQTLGVRKGDRVVIYMPLIPEAIVAMLSVARLGAIHSVVFGGFAASELCTRIEHAEPKVIIAANCGLEPNKIIPYLDILHEAIAISKWQPTCSVVFQRSNVFTSLINPATDIDWNVVINMSQPVDCVPVEANDPLYILYTSGTTDKPKGIQRPIGGHLVALMHSMTAIYNLDRHDVWWAASDLGWVVGHSYICYGPLLFGCTSLMYEGKPDRTPDPGQYFRIIEQHRVSALFTVPTSFRVIRRADPEGQFGSKYNIDTLRTIYTAGEHCDMETLRWTERTFGVPVLNHWWQTETGSAITATWRGGRSSSSSSSSSSPVLPPLTAGRPYVGYDIHVVRPDGSAAQPNELGRLLVKLPLPPGTMSTLYGNDELFCKTYFCKYPGFYDTMDAGYVDADGHVFVTARADDVINVAGHRISTFCLEDAVLRHPDVADAAVFGVPEPTKGEVPCCLYIAKAGVQQTAAKLSAEIVQTIRDIIGPIASFRLIAPVTALPRTRSGKTMRKAMADMARNNMVVLPATVEDPSVFQDIRRALQELGYARNALDSVPNLGK